MFIVQLFALHLVVCAPLSVPGFASSALCEAAAPSVARAMRSDGKGTAVGRCVPSTAPRAA